MTFTSTYAEDNWRRKETNSKSGKTPKSQSEAEVDTVTSSTLCPPMHQQKPVLLQGTTIKMAKTLTYVCDLDMYYVTLDTITASSVAIFGKVFGLRPSHTRWFLLTLVTRRVIQIILRNSSIVLSLGSSRQFVKGTEKRRLLHNCGINLWSYFMPLFGLDKARSIQQFVVGLLDKSRSLQQFVAGLLDKARSLEESSFKKIKQRGWKQELSWIKERLPYCVTTELTGPDSLMPWKRTKNFPFDSTIIAIKEPTTAGRSTLLIKALINYLCWPCRMREIL